MTRWQPIPRVCARHRETLAELADRLEATPAGAAAVAHVERCPDCAAVLGDLVLTVVALRRMAAPTTPAHTQSIGRVTTVSPAGEVGDTTWSRLVDRIERSRRAAREQAWRWRTSLGGMLASALVVGALVGPAAVHLGADTAGLPTLSGADLDSVSWQIEADYVSGARAVPISLSASDDAIGVVGFRRYPDDLKPIRKEVAPARSSGQLPDAR